MLFRTILSFQAIARNSMVGLFALLSASPTGATVIRMNYTVAGQSFGSADFRLYDAAMPRSVANFLGYIDRYGGTFIHRNPRGPFGQPSGNFVVQGGGFAFSPPNSAPLIQMDPAILDEPGAGVQGISNLRGTLSNAKSGPDTVTSQWFVNLADNSFLDDAARPEGGFAAFGRVLGDGISVFDSIDLLDKLDLDGVSSSLFNEVPVGDASSPLTSLVILSGIDVLDFSDGDYNFDGVVDLADYNVYIESLGSTTLAEADGNGNGIVDAPDLAIWFANVPEPAGAFLAAIGLLGLANRR